MGAVRGEEGFPIPAMVLLVKPQFEAGRQIVSRGRGIVTDPEVHAQACEVVADEIRELGGTVVGVVESPIKGAEGNTEFLMFVECPTSSLGL